jgi:hypothetical protein
MGGFKISPSKFRKVQGDTKTLSTLDDKEIVEAIVKVRIPDYVPAGVEVRTRIDPHIMTGVLPKDSLINLEADPQVESVSVSQRLRIIE